MTDKKWRFIDVPFADKDEAKALGAKWHPEARLWHVPKNIGRKKFRWPDAVLTAERLAEIAALSAKRERRDEKERRKKYKAPDQSKFMATNRMARDADARLAHLLGSPQ